MDRSRIKRAIPVIVGCSGIVAGSSYARGASLGGAAGAGLFIALASTGILAAFLMIRQLGRWTRHKA